MGGHYGSIHVRTEDRDAVRAAVEGLACERTKRFLIAPAIGGWVTVYPEGHGQDAAVSTALAAKLSDKTLIHCSVYDDDVFAYWLFDGGKEVGAYNSCPDYFEEQNPMPLPNGGNAQAFGDLLKDSKKTGELQALLKAERHTFELERQDKFAELLGLPNTAYSYEYLQAGETDGVRLWKKFIHVPDLAPEKSARRAAAAAEREEFKQLQRDGLLLVNELGKRSENKHFYKSPLWLEVPETSSVLLSWRDHWDAGPVEWQRFSPPHWRGEKWEAPAAAGGAALQFSPSGSWIAVYSRDRSQIDILDARENRLVAQKKFMGSVNGMTFSADENWLFVTVHSQAPLTRFHRMALRAGLEDAVLTDEKLHFRRILAHPDGRMLLAVDNYGVLVVIEVETMRIINQAWIKEQNSQLPDDLREVIATKGTETILDTLKDRMSPAQADRYREQSARHFIPKEAVMSCRFSPDGQWLLCGTVNGLRVLDWNDVWQGPDMKKVPVRFSADGESALVEIRGHSIKTLCYVHGLAYDALRRRALFCGQHGKVSFLDLNDGSSGTVLAQPGRIPMQHLDLTPDRSAIVATAQRHGDHSNMDKPCHFQIWSYPALCRKAGLEW